MDDVSLGKGNFARVELATHDMTHIKVRVARIQHGASAYFLCQRVVSINSFLGVTYDGCKECDCVLRHI